MINVAFSSRIHSYTCESKEDKTYLEEFVSGVLSHPVAVEHAQTGDLAASTLL
jgi:hypothetical protein